MMMGFLGWLLIKNPMKNYKPALMIHYRDKGEQNL